MDKKANIKLIISILILSAILVGICYAVSITVTPATPVNAVSNYIINGSSVVMLNFSINNTATAGDNITNITIDITGNLTFIIGSNITNSSASNNFTVSGNSLFWNITDSSYSANVTAWFAFNVTPNGEIEYANVSINITARNTSGDTASSIVNKYWVDNRSPRVGLLTINLTNSSTNVSVLLNFSVSDITNQSCDLYVNDSTWEVKKTGNANNSNNVGFVYNFSGDGTYLWNVLCNDTAGNYAFNSTNFTITIDTIPPTTAPNITAVTDSDADGNINITWTADSNAMMYGVFRANSNLTNATDATRLANVTTTYFVDNTTTHGTTYWYGVTSIDYAGNENLSIINTTTGAFLNGTANDTIAPAKGAGINGTLAASSGTTNNQIDLRWSNISTDAAGNSEWNVSYVVYYKSSSTAVNTSPTDGNLNTSGYSVHYNNTANSTSFSCTDCTSNTTYHFFVTTLDDGGNVNLSVTTGAGGNYLNTTLKYTASTSDDGNGGGGGGGGGGTTTAAEGVSASKMWSVLAKGASTMSISKTTIAITELILNMKNQVSNAEVTVTKLDEKPSSLSAAPGETYQYLKIEKKVIKNEDFENVKIKFRVTKSWLTTEGINEGDVGLNKYTTKWIKLSTKKISSDATYATYEATTSSFSYFAITGKKAGIKTATLTGEEELEEGAIEAEAAEGAEAAEEKEPGKRKSWLGWVIVSAVIIIGLIVYFIVISKKKKEESQEQFY